MRSNTEQESMKTTAYCHAVSSADTDAVRKLWECCFEDSGAFVQWYFDSYYRPEQTLGVYTDEGIVASAQVIPYDVSLRGGVIPAGYVVGVDTDPAHRRRGYARTLLLECLKQMKEQKQPIGFLMPFEGRFYYRYGWQYVCFHQVVRCKAAEMLTTARQWGMLKGIPAREAKNHIPELDGIYRAFVEDYDGAVQRTPQKWQDTLTDMEMEHAVCYLLQHPDTGEMVGYFYYLVLKDKRISIPEIAWVDETARKALLWYITDLVPEDYSLEMHLPADDSLMYELATNKRAVFMEPFVMARIVDVKQCLEQLGKGKPGQRMTLQVADSFAEWNDASFLLQCNTEGSVQVLRPEENLDDTAAQKADLEISVEGLTLLVMGSRSAGQLHKAGMLKTDNAEALQMINEMFPETKLFFNEYY